jgi:hypothetical protein
MSELESPYIEGFRPVSYRTHMGVGFITMKNASEVSPVGLSLSEQGVEAIELDQSLADLFAQMGEFIAKHDQFYPHAEVQQAIPSISLYLSRPSGQGFRPRSSSVYRPLAQPGTVIKAYDYDHKSATLQFPGGAALHRAARNIDDLHFPAQYALFTSVREHHAAVLEHISGSSLSSVIADEAIPGRLYKDLEKRAKRVVAARISKLGILKALVSDLDTKHIILPEDRQESPLEPDVLEHLPYIIIDQPGPQLKARVVTALLRHAA